MSELIHALALVDPGASLGAGVSVGPFAVVGAGVVLEAGCRVGPHAVIRGDTQIGRGTSIDVGAVIGGQPQMRGPARDGRLRIGEENRIGEYVTVHGGSEAGLCTQIGDQNFLMAYVHIAHDCVVGNGNEIANASQLAGHVEIDDDVTVGGLVAFHQGVRVGRLAMIGGGSMVSRDILPFACASGDRARVYGNNDVGMKRAGFSTTKRSVIRRTLLALSRATTREGGVAAARRIIGAEEPAIMAEIERFVERSRRGLAPLVGRWSSASR